MAEIVLNPAIQVISGDVAGFVYRQQSDGSVVLAKKAVLDPDRQPTEAQAEQLQKFKEASARYTRLMEDAGVQGAYQKLAAERGPKSRLRAMVIGDILKAPKISTLDLSNYQGAVGDTIRIIAEDNVGVSRLTLSIRDVTENRPVESSEMALNGKVKGTVEWVYAATQSIPSGHEAQVHVTAYDLAGNVIEADLTM
jgi:hypothetical protein